MMIQKSIRTTLAALAVFSFCSTPIQAGPAVRVAKALIHGGSTTGGLLWLKQCYNEATDNDAEFTWMGRAELLANVIAACSATIWGVNGLIEDATAEDEDVAETAFNE